jgi:hypothetical protein
MVTFRGPKTDQYNEGCKRYVGMTGNHRCAIKAFREWFELEPRYFDGVDASERPMCDHHAQRQDSGT